MLVDELRRLSAEAGWKSQQEFDYTVNDWTNVCRHQCREAAKSHRFTFTFYPKVPQFQYNHNVKDICMAVKRKLENDGLKVEVISGRGTPYVTIDWSHSQTGLTQLN